MGSRQPLIVSLEEVFDYPAELLGNKACNLSLFMREGFHVPAGFCISAESYLASDSFISQTDNPLDHHKPCCRINRLKVSTMTCGFKPVSVNQETAPACSLFSGNNIIDH